MKIRRNIFRLPAIFSLIAVGIAPLNASALDTLTNAASVLALSAKEAGSNIPVNVTGVVTAAEHSATWLGRFFVQDASGGVFVEYRPLPGPSIGDVVQVTGITHPGGYAPVISRPTWKKIGTAPLPKAKPVSTERLMSGAEDSQRVEVSGIVRTAELSGDPNGSRIGIQVASGGYRFRAFFPPSPSLDPQSLVGAKVTIRGTAAAAFNAPLRHFLTVTLFVPRPDGVIVDIPAPTALFDEPPVPLNSIAQYRQDPPPGYQVHVKGVVTYQQDGEGLFLRDATGGLQVKSTTTNLVAPGDVVEAVGFPAVENYLPVLEDAVVRKTSDPRTILEPTNTTVSALQQGLHHADFVALRGQLLDRLVRGIGTSGDSNSVQTTLILQASNMVFAVEKETTEANTLLTSIPIGSIVEARGICLLDGSSDGHIKSFRILLPASHDVRVIEEPSWLTAQHLLTILVSALAVLVLAIAWTIWVTNKNSMLKAAKQELQQAHDLLEERVKERTAQLKVEMTARKESELQFRAVLTERTRLAQELHDTLEETLTGIALQQDLVASQFEKNPDHATHHLKLARNLMRQSRDDLHRSVWGLRSRADEEFTLASALFNSVRQITGDTGIRVESETTGESGPLSEIMEENILRMGQEAVNNVVKHAGATVVDIQLHFSPQQVVLQIQDNGKGFDPETCTGPKDGHFGLLGIRERTERLAGRVQINSTPGIGTTIRVEIPVPATNGAATSAPTANGDSPAPAPAPASNGHHNGTHEERS